MGRFAASYGEQVAIGAAALGAPKVARTFWCPPGRGRGKERRKRFLRSLSAPVITQTDSRRGRTSPFCRPATLTRAESAGLVAATLSLWPWPKRTCSFVAVAFRQACDTWGSRGEPSRLRSGGRRRKDEEAAAAAGEV